MNKKGTRNTNGEGGIYNVIQKIKRSKKLDFECENCKGCTDRKSCNNRSNTLACDKCKNCTSCLKKGFCDMFYIYERYQAQITIDGKQTTVANGAKKKETVDKKLQAESERQTKTYIKKNGITILEVIKKLDATKFEAGKICDNTKAKNQYHYNYINKFTAFDKPAQKITYQEVQEFLNSIRHLSQGEIEKIRDKLKAGFMQCVMDKIIAYPDNPMLRIYTPVSLQIKEPVQAFEVEEQKKLMSYITSHTLIKNQYKCKYDEITLRNLFICSLLSAARIGELGALSIDDINLKEKYFNIRRTLTLVNSKIVIGETTKTGRRKIQQGLTDERQIPLNIFDESLMLKIIKEQITHSQNNFLNKNKLLFCQKDGSCIDHRTLNTIFKRVCREAGVKLNLATGCHIHMCRHTATTRMIEAGMDILVIAHILGHSDDRQIKETYGHILQTYRNKQLKDSQSYYKSCMSA